MTYRPPALAETKQRNAKIAKDYARLRLSTKRSAAVEKLSEKYKLSFDTILRIITITKCADAAE